MTKYQLEKEILRLRAIIVMLGHKDALDELLDISYLANQLTEMVRQEKRDFIYDALKKKGITDSIVNDMNGLNKEKYMQLIRDLEKQYNAEGS